MIKWPWSRPAPSSPPAPPAVAPRRRGVSAMALATVTAPARQSLELRPAQPAPGVLPASVAMDSAIPSQVTAQLGWAQAGMFQEGIGFEGFPYLSQLAQRAEYRRMVEILAKEMTRKWITLTTGDDADDSKLAPLAQAMKDYRVRSLFRQAFEHDGFFGRGQIFVDTGVEPEIPLAAVKDVITPETPLRFQVVEPYWSYPGFYDADDPLSEWFYKPRSWWVNGKTVAASRMITIVSRELPDILKPVYQFAGLPLTQMAKPYVDNWLTTRQSVNDLLGNFSTTILMTDMASVMNEGGGESLMNRVALFNRYKSNRGTFVADKDSEDVKNVSASLASLDKLQAQAQEHMSSVSGIPLVVLLGITPSGLNATSEGELQAFYSWVAALQEDVLRDPIQRVLDLLQLKTFGEIDPAITFQFNPLWEESAEGQALRRKTEADAAAVYIDRGVISPDEERDRLKRDEESAYDLEGDAPELPEPDPADNPFGEQGVDDGQEG